MYQSQRDLLQSCYPPTADRAPPSITMPWSLRLERIEEEARLSSTSTCAAHRRGRHRAFVVAAAVGCYRAACRCRCRAKVAWPVARVVAEMALILENHRKWSGRRPLICVLFFDPQKCGSSFIIPGWPLSELLFWLLALGGSLPTKRLFDIAAERGSGGCRQPNTEKDCAPTIPPSDLYQEDCGRFSSSPSASTPSFQSISDNRTGASNNIISANVKHASGNTIRPRHSPPGAGSCTDREGGEG